MRAIATLLVLLTLPAAAQTDAPTIRIDPAACRYVARHQPSADVEYKPGVDVHGDAVAPADLPDGYAIELPKSIDIAITSDIARRFGIATNNLYRGEAQIGTVTLQGNQVLFNGKPMQSAAEADLIALCAKTPH
ncbi:hypothetical protein [Niveispirillum sp.]|uniref:hypothetical protein n=1 Tax=Niveispirillum sp. TaxID=1917217 RepID=UPI0025E69310|nr:hypothetical protein [Niveispirillum sp.]